MLPRPEGHETDQGRIVEDGNHDETSGTVRIGRVGARLTEHALNALPDPQSVQDHLRRLGDSVGIDHGADEVPRWVRHARLVVGAAQVW